ncbi:TlpA family protein disulfide reductase [Bacillus niameyensis]|uniref:TlpA family protein disulfide reductase n=1 Tax=Bacillus niameyensis TaxID=1522308 RepID=UPI000783B6E9|nr:TlpA disulfide reductase family protein [Bacillus niameyensis]
MKEKILYLLLVFSIGVFFLDQYVIGKERSNVTTNQVDVGVQSGQKAVDFQLETRNGAKISLSDYRKKIVFINFWASWCPPCRAEMPHIQEFYEEYQDKDFEVLSVNLTNLERSVDHVEKFIDQYDMTFPVIYDLEGEVDEIYKIQTIPTSIIVDKDGIIRYRLVGPVSKERLMQIITSLE